MTVTALRHNAEGRSSGEVTDPPKWSPSSTGQVPLDLQTARLVERVISEVIRICKTNSNQELVTDIFEETITKLGPAIFVGKPNETHQVATDVLKRTAPFPFEIVKMRNVIHLSSARPWRPSWFLLRATSFPPSPLLSEASPIKVRLSMIELKLGDLLLQRVCWRPWGFALKEDLYYTGAAFHGCFVREDGYSGRSSTMSSTTFRVRNSSSRR